MPCHSKIVTHTPSPEHVIATAARKCYDSKTENDVGLIKFLLKQNHLSPFEHAAFTFDIFGVSRALLAQLTRHRFFAFSVRSQRYVNESGFEYVIPPSIIEAGYEEVFKEQMATINGWYNNWVSTLGISKKEDARFVLPNACTTTLIASTNARELWHFFKVREDKAAQWEIRRLAKEMHENVMEVAPNIFS